ncbi:MAG: cofactor-independent phosphoglycerate mutase [Desulfobulbaceae bacterium]|nr:cofactor-independent phosphoglycerate mutase [Desulfobulbaceae bacterium]HIJ77823.1 cofactor-independent phosphoglycerate mutase [Deltaproteobacteria bacterium]
MKYIILVGDGMGDLPLAELDNQTPLAAAKTPAMDYLAAEGELHLLQTVPDGFPPGSDVANLSLLGYLPTKCYSGRAPLEAASMGVQLGADEVAFRCNLVSLDFKDDGTVKMVDYSAGHISSAEARILVQGLDQAAGSDQLKFHPGISYRHLLVHKGVVAELETVPPHDHTGKDVTRYWQRYQAIPQFKEMLAKAVAFLSKHEVNQKRSAANRNQANAIWLWGEGKAPTMPTIKAQFGVSGALISAVDLLKGIGVYADLEIINVDGATGYLDTNYQGKADAALKALESKDLVFVHVEAPDEAGHQGLLKEKMQAIEDFDSRIVKPIFEGMKQRGEDFRLVIAMDHFTPLSLQTHTSQPVPVAIYDSRGKGQGSGLAYNEENATAAGSMIGDGLKFFKRILEQQ